MSFQLLKSEIIDPGLCQGCGLCVGSCKHLELKDLRPNITDFCIMEKQGLQCGKCYTLCPQIRRKAQAPHEIPLEILAVQSTDETIRARAASGGFVTTLNKYLLESGTVNELVEIKNVEGLPKAMVTRDASEVRQFAGTAYGRSGSLQKLVELLGESHGQVGIVGVPCEIQGAAEIEKNMKINLFKIGLFCNANIRTGEIDEEGHVFSPCRHGCPASVDSSAYVKAIREGKFDVALEIIRENNPLPSICGYVCTHECEYNCTLIGTNHPIAIRELKKFVTDWERDQAERHWDQFSPRPDGKKVAIVGSGPAGLTAGYYLAKLGYHPTIFEKSDQVGGMLRFGVPKYRLPDEVLDYDINFIKNAGVEIRLNTTIGPDLTFETLKKQGYEAIFLAIGQYAPISLHLPGENLPNVYFAINFLVQRKYRHWENLQEFKDQEIAVIGGGPVGVDVAETALRLGAKKAYLIELRDEKALEIVRKDIPEYEQPFISYVYDTQTLAITQNETKLTLSCQKISLDNSDGSFKINKIAGSEFSMQIDSVVIAVGQSVDFSLIDRASKDVITKQKGKVLVDETTFQTNIPGVFAGGDIVVRGKNVAVAAIGQGREAAYSIDRYLRGLDPKAQRSSHNAMFFTGPLNAPKDTSIRPTVDLESEEDWRHFDIVDGMFNREMAISEANRCLTCNNFCAHCQDFAAAFADVAAGDIGTEKGFSTVIIWTKRAQKIVHAMLDKFLLRTGTVDPDAVNKAIGKKLKRKILDHAPSIREKIELYIKLNGPQTISQLSEGLQLLPKDVKYHGLRLVQEKKFSMEIASSEPKFATYVEE